MKNLIKIILLILIPVVGVLLLSYPGVWKYRVESILNRQVLKDSGWKLSLGDLNGHLFGEIESQNIEILHENGTKIVIPELSTQFNIAQSLTGKINLQDLNISDLQFYQSDKNTDDNKVFILPDLDYRKFPLTIERLKFGGELKIVLVDTTHLIKMDILGSIIPNNNGLNLAIGSLLAQHNDLESPFSINDTQININDRKITLNPFIGKIDDIRLNGQMTFIQSDKQQLNGFMNVRNINIPEELFEEIPLKVKFSEINSKIRFNTDFNNYSGTINLINDLGLNMSGDFNITKQTNRWLIQQVTFNSDDTRLFVHGDYIDNNIINANIDLQQLDLSKWLTQQRETNISGKTVLQAKIDDGKLNYVSLDLTTQESKLFKNDTITVDGAFVYNDNQIDIANPLTISIGPSSVTSTGKINLSKEEVDLELALQNLDVFLINNFWDDSLKNGSISGELSVAGKFTNPKVFGKLIGKEIEYKDYYLSEIEIEGYRDQIGDSLGFASVQLGEGNWRDISFKKGNFDATFKNKETHFTNLNIINGDEYLSASGRLDNKNSFYIDNLKSFYQNHYFVNTNPFYISLQEGNLSVSPFIAHFDDGVIEGEINYKDVLLGSIRFTNIDAEILHNFIPDDRYKLSGNMFGDILFEENNGFQVYLMDGSVKNGSFSKEPFEQIKVKMSISNNLLSIEEAFLQENDSSRIEIAGSIPLGNAQKTEKIQLQSKFINTNIKSITQFAPDWFELTGRLTGNLNIFGTGHNLLSNFEFNAKDATFDKINLGMIQGNGIYDGNKLTLQSFTSTLNNEQYKGFGYVPVDLNILSDTFAEFKGNDPIYLLVEGDGTNADFITNYFDEVDSAIGEYNFALELSGIWDNIIRNGRVSAKNVIISSPFLDDPILNMHGLVNINNNQLIIDNLQGKMYQSDRRINRKPDNVSLSGGMDMTEFFKPNININTVGNEAYFRSLIYEIEGVTDFDINISGKDTVLFSGEVAPIDVELFQQLTTNDLGILPSEEGSAIVHFKIDFPIKGKLSLSNDQLEAVMIGDVSINQFGDREPDFAGELIIEEGKFYYYRDVFIIEEGYLTFDNRGFNPYMDIVANTEIDGERIDVSIVGQIENPTLTFTSENNFSQSDILELLTWRKRFEEKEISSSEIGTQGLDFAVSWFGSQLDKNILELSGLNRLGILEDVNVRGTTGLITAEEDFSISAPLTDKVAINYAYRRSFGLSDSNHALGVELRLTRNLSLVGNIDRSGYMHVKYRIRYAY